MTCAVELETPKPSITRAQEASLYKFLSKQTENDALRYELIAKKIHRAADGAAINWELDIVNHWLGAMLEEQLAKENRYVSEILPRESFADVRSGQVGNPNYQAYLDTLEQDELNLITSNVGYLCWFSTRQSEQPNGFSPDWLRSWADNNLSARVKSIRGLV
jgi:hypothetical protein